MNNRFLEDFMRRQTEIIQSNIPAEESKGKGKGKKSKHGTASGEHPFGEADALARIISEKPPKKHVLNYFRDRVAQLVAADTDL